MENQTGSTERAQSWRGLIELVIGSALIAGLFLLAIFVATTN